nr:adenosylcobalamin-dependent ribonucleoside-diphosphate reductase [Candidatus Sigynarchaeota archaeon]
MKLNELGLLILRERYLLRNERGEIIETPEEMFKRVSTEVAKADLKCIDTKSLACFQDDILVSMLSLEFLPNSPTLMNAGTATGQLSACFVLPVEDDLESIFDALKKMTQVHKSGGGTGFSFSSLRPSGDLIHSTMSMASGPLSFIEVFDTATQAIVQGGRRRGANMGILDVTHPDIEKFINAKLNQKSFKNFNFSVAVTDEFLKSVEANGRFSLINPRTQKIMKTIQSADLFDAIARAAWSSGDPGLIFIDAINKANPTPELGPITSTNPCGEVPLYAHESCNLGSINLNSVVKDKRIDWDKLRHLVRTGVRFLDNVIDVNKYPLAEIDVATKLNRKIGLGIMGFADMLIMLGIQYTSKQALEVAENVMKFIDDEARKVSIELGQEKGSFPNFTRSIYKHEPAMRNATRTAIAPTGTISLIAGVSSGIEPVFSVYHRREIAGLGLKDYYHPLFVEQLQERVPDVQKILDKVKEKRSINVQGVPDDMKELYIPAFDIEPGWHVEIQAAFQHHVDNSVSKTINMPESATVDDVKSAYMKAWKKKCKGITIYRYNSQSGQVLDIN